MPEDASVKCNNLSITDSNKIENMQRKFPNLCYCHFFHSDILHNYYLILNSLNIRILHSRRHLNALFLMIAFKGKINCHSILDTVGISVPTRQIREFSTFSMSSALKYKSFSQVHHCCI
jgi:hypothetical protein